LKVLVINTGSSSLKFGIFDLSLADSRIFKAEFSKFSATGCLLTWRTGGGSTSPVAPPPPPLLSLPPPRGVGAWAASRLDQIVNAVSQRTERKGYGEY
jgi:hypothetical protein